MALNLSVGCSVWTGFKDLLFSEQGRILKLQLEKESKLQSFNVWTPWCLRKAFLKKFFTTLRGWAFCSDAQPSLPLSLSLLISEAKLVEGCWLAALKNSLTLSQVFHNSLELLEYLGQHLKRQSPFANRTRCLVKMQTPGGLLSLSSFCPPRTQTTEVGAFYHWNLATGPVFYLSPMLIRVASLAILDQVSFFPLKASMKLGLQASRSPSKQHKAKGQISKIQSGQATLLRRMDDQQDDALTHECVPSTCRKRGSPQHGPCSPLPPRAPAAVIGGPALTILCTVAPRRLAHGIL